MVLVQLTTLFFVNRHQGTKEELSEVTGGKMYDSTITEPVYQLTLYGEIALCSISHSEPAKTFSLPYCNVIF